MSFGDSVWKRGSNGHNELSKRQYIATVCMATIYGLIVSSIISFFALNWNPSFWILLLVGLGIPIVGIFIALGSDNWMISFFGYTLVVLGFGAILGPMVHVLETGTLMLAVMATAGVTVTMSIIGIIYPKSLEHWGGYLAGALLALIFVRLGQAVIISLGIMESLWYISFIEYGAVILFSLYIIYDWNRSLRLTRTLDNAVDSAVAIYLDIINLFVTLARIFSNKND